jgi:hypothetical protein
MFSRVNKQVRLMICFLAAVCATVLLSGVSMFDAQSAHAVGSHIRKAPTGYYYQAPVPSNPINAAFAASHQEPNFYN